MHNWRLLKFITGVVLAVFLTSTIPVVAFGVSVAGSAQDAQTVLNNDDVLQMVAANLSEGLILSQIRSSRTAFDLSVTEVIRLSNSGVSDVVITAMQTAASAPDTAQPVATPAAEVPEPAAVAATPPPAVPDGGTVADGLLRGTNMAKDSSGTGRGGTGFAVGLLTGFIGTGIGYALIGSAPLSGQALLDLQNTNNAYQQGFREGWEKETKSKKRSSFTKGGVIGSLVGIAAVVLIYQAQEQSSYSYSY
jgi:hypothetical protein